MSSILLTTLPCKLINTPLTIALRKSPAIWKIARFNCLSYSNEQNEVEKRDKNIYHFDFNDYKNAFKTKTMSEIIRALFVFRLFSFDYIVANSLKLMNLGQRVLGQRLFNMIITPTIYSQFVAGQDKECIEKTVQRLNLAAIRPLVYVPMEEDESNSQSGETRYEKNLEIIQNCLELTKSLKAPVPMMHFKMTALMSADLLILLSKYCLEQNKVFNVENMAEYIESGKEFMHESLTRDQRSHLKHTFRRLKIMGEMAERLKLRVILDAEYVKMNAGQAMITLALMTVFNQRRAMIWNTYQCYLKATHELICNHLQTVNNLGAHFGAKIVRGAYMDLERKYAKLGGYADPVNATYEDTSKMYYKVVNAMLERLKTTSPGSNMIIATHNEDSIMQLIQRISELDFGKGDEHICFGQIYGMCDQVSYALGQAGYIVYKSIPYGPIVEVLPYLSRRAMENSSILQGVRKERLLHWNEFKRRILRS